MHALSTVLDVPLGEVVARNLLERSQLVRMGGAVVTTVVDGGRLCRLRDEALAVHANAQEARSLTPNDLAHGDPDRWLESAQGGVELNALYHDGDLLALLRQLTDLHWRTAGSSGSYSYYRRQGHHLGLHRDIDACELACITCVHDSGPRNEGESGILRLYPTRTGESLEAIRRSADRGAVDFRLRPGDTMILLGGLVPHRLLPMGANHLRIVAPLCYQVARD